jgi:hypothetical protein
MAGNLAWQVSNLKLSTVHYFMHGVVLVPAILFAALSAALENRNRFASFLSYWFASFLALFW